jgi:outer membrane protein assembly factor BamB
MPDSATKLDKTPAARASNRLALPGLTSRLVIGGALAMIVLIRILARLDDPPQPFHDPAHRNIATLIFGFVALLTTWIWLCFQSGLAPWIRRTAAVGSLIVVAGLVAALRYEEVDGSMMPRFVPRWAAVHHAELGAIPARAPTDESQIDLTTTTPDDFPQFLGPQRMPWLPGPQLARDWSATPPRELWKQPIGAGWSGFAARNGYAVTLEQRGDEEWVSCYEIATGKPVWGHAVTARHYNAMGGVGPRSTPTIHNGRVYALGATGILRCLDGASGTLVWQDDLLDRYGISQEDFEAMVNWGRAGSPLIVDDLVVVPAGGKKGRAKTLVALRAETGDLVWNAENVIEGDGTTDQIAYASPVLATLAGRRQILIVNESTASGHDPKNGVRLWSHPWPGHSNMNASSSQAVPIEPDRVLLSKGYGGGAEMLRLKPGSDGLLEVESVSTGGEEGVWRDPRVLQTKFSNIVVHEGHLYGLSEGILECVEVDTGKRQWKHSRGRYGHGQILGVGDLLLVLAEDGRLALVELSPRRFTELGSIQALQGKTWNTLCLYGKKLLIRNAQEAACYELP